jgi:hypothetical protein
MLYWSLWVWGVSVSRCANNCYYSYILGEPNTSQSVIYYTDWLWCQSFTHHYFCANLSGPPKHSHFLIPLVETLHLVVGRYCIEGFLLASKLSEKNS